tara:strand:- start:58 stop:492 length:435 start_codon:yes stop_codon:yes gene_type:complete
MANHKSAIKRTRSDYTKNQKNKYLHKTVRNAIKKLQTEKKSVKKTDISKVFSLIDKLVKSNIIHKNKAAHLKSKLSKLNIDSIVENPKTKKTPKASQQTKVSVEAVEEESVEVESVEEGSVEEESVEEGSVEEASTEKDSTEKE